MKIKLLTLAVSTALSLFLFTGCTDKGPQAEKMVEQDLSGTIVLEDITLTVNETGLKDQVAPPDPYGYYTYYEEHYGYQYYVASVTVKNESDRLFNSSSCLVTADMADESRAEGKLVLLNEVDTDFQETLDAGKECKGYLFVLVKKEAGIPETVNIYYNHGFTVKEDAEQYDMKNILRVIS